MVLLGGATADKTAAAAAAAADKAAPAAASGAPAAAAAAASSPETATAAAAATKKHAMSGDTVVRICFMKLCEYCDWTFTSTETRRRRWLAENKGVQPPPFRLLSEQYKSGTSNSATSSNGNLSSPLRQASPFASSCSLGAALIALSALDETTTSEYVLEELQYYLLIQTLLHGDPLADTITVPEAATLFKAKMHRPVVSFAGFQRLFEDNGGLDEAGIQRLVALLDVQRSMYQRLAFLEDRDESFAREQIWHEMRTDSAELLSAMRRTREVAELRAQLSRATARRIEQAQVMASMGALQLESVKKDMRESIKSAAEAQRLAIAVESAIAAARTTAEALADEAGVHTRAFAEEKARVVHECEEGCREALQHAAHHWELLDMRIERLERLMTGVGRSALVCSMSHLPLAEHQKILPSSDRKSKKASANTSVTSNSSNNKKSAFADPAKMGNKDDDDDDADLDEGLEWLSLSTAERFGLMSACHVLRDSAPSEQLVTAAVALTLSDQCVFSRNATSQIEQTVLFATVAFLAVAEADTAKVFLCKTRDGLPNVLDILAKSALVPGPGFDAFLEMMAVDLPGGAAMWRAAIQHPAHGASGSGGTGGKPYVTIAGYKAPARPPPLIGSTRHGHVETPGLHNRYQPGTASTFRVGVSPFDLSVAASTVVSGAHPALNTSGSNNNTGAAAAALSRTHGDRSTVTFVGSGSGSDDVPADDLTFAGGHNYSRRGELGGGINASAASNNNNSSAAGVSSATARRRLSDAQLLVEAAASVTLGEFVKCLSDVARVYLGPACAGSSAEHCLHLLLRWKATPLAPLMPLINMSLMLRRGPGHLPQRVPVSRNLASSYSDMNATTTTTASGPDRNLFSPPPAAGGRSGNNAASDDERQSLAQPRYSQAWNRLVGTGDKNTPTIGDVAAFLLAHFPDVIAASRGWDSTGRAGFSGSELFVVRSVLFVVMCVGTWRCPRTRADAEGFDFVRALGTYKEQAGGGGGDTPASPASAFVELDKRPIGVGELQAFVASRPCPWPAVLEAWPEGEQFEQPQLQQRQPGRDGQQQQQQQPFGAGDWIFQEAVANSGLPTEVLQAFPAWETIARVVRRAETSIQYVDNNGASPQRN